YRASRSGGTPALVTNFDAEVTNVVGVSEEAGVVYFLASPSNATERYLYRAPLDGASAPVRVTPAGADGWHTYTPAPGAKLAFHAYSSFDRVTTMDVVSLPAHRSLRALTDASPLQATLGDRLRPPVEFVKVPVGGGVTLYGWVLKPASFDASKKYP